MFADYCEKCSFHEIEKEDAWETVSFCNWYEQYLDEFSVDLDKVCSGFDQIKE